MGRYRDTEEWEKLAHEVTLASPFYMGKYEVTQEQYQQVMGTNPSQFRGPSLPVEMVSWDDAKEFCKRATAVPHSAGLRNQQSGKVLYRLPTEAEWEFACRAGTTTTYYTGDAEADLGRAAWYGANSKNTTHPVGQKEPNAFGLHDTHGNVFEWCLDHWQGKYSPEAAVDPQGPPEGQYRVLRGGSWFGDLGDCRSASRTWGTPGFRDGVVGFRVVASAPHGNDGR
jgi:formylglycine-generating enzyme required for sulfatase activity